MASTSVQRTPTNRAPSRSKGSYDLGAYITEKTGYEPDKVKETYRDVDLWDETFRFSTNPSIFALLSLGSGETNDIIDGLLAVIHAEDRKAFQRLIIRLRDFDAEQFLALLEGLVELYTEGKASAQSGGSPRTTRPKAVSKRSTAS